MTPHKNRLDEMVLMKGHKIYFYKELCKFVPKLSLLPLLICSSTSEAGLGEWKWCWKWGRDVNFYYVTLSLTAAITTAADDIHKYFFIVLRENKT